MSRHSKIQKKLGYEPLTVTLYCPKALRQYRCDRNCLPSSIEIGLSICQFDDMAMRGLLDQGINCKFYLMT